MLYILYIYLDPVKRVSPRTHFILDWIDKLNKWESGTINWHLRFRIAFALISSGPGGVRFQSREHT